MSRTTRTTRWRLGLAATAALAVASVLVPAPAHAEAVADYAITVDPSATGATIDDTMYGVFFEDINRAADGGLYAELVQNRSFEYSTADNTSYTPLTSWTVDGTAQVVDDASLAQRAQPQLPLPRRRFVGRQHRLQHRHPAGAGQEVRLLGVGPRHRRNDPHRLPQGRRR
ncbi:hypothetical protein SGLAM104S_03113 [Streptomyces glaucescens]